MERQEINFICECGIETKVAMPCGKTIIGQKITCPYCSRKYIFNLCGKENINSPAKVEKMKYFESRYKTNMDNNVFRRLSNSFGKKEGEDMELVHEDVANMLNDIEAQMENISNKYGLTIKQLKGIISYHPGK